MLRYSIVRTALRHGFAIYWGKKANVSIDEDMRSEMVELEST